MDVSFSDYIISLETFIENKANSGKSCIALRYKPAFTATQ